MTKILVAFSCAHVLLAGANCLEPSRMQEPDEERMVQISKSPEKATCSSSMDAEVYGNLNLLQTSLQHEVVQDSGNQQLAQVALHSDAMDAAELYTNPFQRVWFLCLTAPDHPTPKEEKLAGLAAVAEMKCTRQMTFKSLCCLPYNDTPKNLSFEFSWHMQIPSARDDASDKGESLPIRLFTEGAAGSTLMQKSNMTEANLQLEEVASFSEADLRGDSTMGAGEVVLRARIAFLHAQGIPKASIPTCHKEVAQCEGGAPPATVSEAWFASGDNAASSLLSSSSQASLGLGTQFVSASGSLRLNLPGLGRGRN
jgi:hypothetical protein